MVVSAAGFACVGVGGTDLVATLVAVVVLVVVRKPPGRPPLESAVVSEFRLVLFVLGLVGLLVLAGKDDPSAVVAVWRFGLKDILMV